MRKITSIALFTLSILVFSISCNISKQNEEPMQDELVDMGEVVLLDSMSGLIIDEGLEIVRGNCTPCHSAKIITQNRASREGWEKMIRWMQETQNLWPLGENEPIILDYLAKNYAPVSKGRRARLKDIEWYVLEKE